MTISKEIHLSRRERQIMDVIYARGNATAQQVMEDLPDAPSYTTVRTLLAIMERKGHLKHRREGVRFVYHPSSSRQHVAKRAITKMVETFFGGSTLHAMAALIEQDDSLSPQDQQDFAEL